MERFGAPDSVIHAASRQPGPFPLTEFVRANIVAAATLVTALRDTPPKQLIYTSTQSVYWKPASLPVTEDDPVGGDNAYTITKLAGEQLIGTVSDRTQVIIFRLPGLYGAGQSDSFVDGLARLAMGNREIELFARGALIRDALHVDDVVAAITSTTLRPPAVPGACLNLGCGRAITTRQYAETIVAAFGSSSKPMEAEQTLPNRFDLYADIRLAKTLVEFEPTPLESSMARYVKELRIQP